MSDQQRASGGPPITDGNTETSADGALVMLSCRIPFRLRRRLKVAASERGLQMAEIVEHAIVTELVRLDQEAK